MENQHITYFGIENFKRFDKFEMKNLGQFNLIVGDNNIGKTTILESLCVADTVETTIANFFSTYLVRKMHTYREINSKEIGKSYFWYFIFKDLETPMSFFFTEDHNNKIVLRIHDTLDVIREFPKFEEDNYINDANQLFHQTRLVNDEVIYNEFRGAYFETSSVSFAIPFVSANSSYDNSLPILFYNFFNSSKKLRKEVENCLRIFIPEIDDIRVHKFFTEQESLCITLKNDDAIFPISQFGDGTVKLTRLLLELIINQNGRLMVDEIGAGIHYLRLKDYWKIILQLCSKYKVQLFATTHSLECQQAFVEALDYEDTYINMKGLQADARNITLLETKQGDVKSVTYDFAQFENAMNIGFNTRGGAI